MLMALAWTLPRRSRELTLRRLGLTAHRALLSFCFETGFSSGYEVTKRIFRLFVCLFSGVSETVQTCIYPSNGDVDLLLAILNMIVFSAQRNHVSMRVLWLLKQQNNETVKSGRSCYFRQHETCQISQLFALNSLQRSHRSIRNCSSKSIQSIRMGTPQAKRQTPGLEYSK
jgi:hypothetical protein